MKFMATLWSEQMKSNIKNLVLLPALIAGLGLIPAARVTAQTITTVHNFTFGSDGGNPNAGLILSSNTLYGTAVYGGNSGNGTVFAVNTDGTGATNLHSFTTVVGSPQTNSDGRFPVGDLILSGNTLYGTAESGGISANGTVFKVNTDGSGFTILHSFTATPDPPYTNSDGASPQAGLILSGTTLYGTARFVGSAGSGTVFAVNTNGIVFTNLHSFMATSFINPVNSDGANPSGRLTLSGNILYGTANYGGSSGDGTVFAVNTDGMGFTNLHSLDYFNDGVNPHAGLILSGNTLYGTAELGGDSRNGSVFAVNTNGIGFTNLHTFTSTSGSPPTNSDGCLPFAGLMLLGNTLYGTANQGGSSGKGAVFAINTNGTGFTNLHSFTAPSGPSLTNSDGTVPFAGLILSGTTLYGTTEDGGSLGFGTVFSLSLGSVSAPQLTIISSGVNVILTWPTNAAGFTLQSTTNLVSPAVWSTVSPGPVIVNGQNAVTNPVSGARQFYRLSQ
jgi:uncharacterized repeat protein (TIGR03803 family)